MASAPETFIRNVVNKSIEKVVAFNRNRMPQPAKPHPFLTGVHEPMDTELTLNELAVEGSIPHELNGRYLRIGPNPIEPPDAASYHWFLGDGMVHGLCLKGGRALWYKNRWIRSHAVTAALGEPPSLGPHRTDFDTVNTNVLSHAGKTWALVEAGTCPVELDDDLNTVAYNPFEGSLKSSFTAHPHMNTSTGELHAVCYDARDQEIIRHVIVGKDGRVRRNEPISVKNGPMVHDCMITKNFVVVLDLPVTFSMKSLLAGHSFPYRWDPSHEARVGLLLHDGSGNDIIWCKVEPCFVFHPSNGYETNNGRVILDVCVHDSMFASSTQGPDSQCVTFERWTINPVSQYVERSVIDSNPQEFPRIDERAIGKPYRYAYTMALPNGHTAAFISENHLIKHDLENDRREMHDFGEGCYPGEFVFVPKHVDASEDEGWLLGYVVNMPEKTTDFVILNAQNFAGNPQAVVKIPHRIPPGFHGNWVPAP